MKRFRSGNDALSSFAFLTLAVALACAPGCDSQTEVSTPWWTPFVEGAQSAQCVDVRNQLYVIDNQLVFVDQEGTCTDQMFSRILYGRTVEDVKCSYYDSLGGAHNTCADPSYRPMFDTILSHRDDADLGLGSTHHVMRLQF